MATRDAQIGGGTSQAGSPFGGSSAGASLAPMSSVGYSVSLPNGQTITVGSEADFLKMREWYSSSQSGASLGGSLANNGGGGGSNAGAMLDIAADGFQAVTGFLAGSNYNAKLQDFQDSRAALLDTRDALVQHRTSAPDQALVDLVLRSVDAQLDHFDSAIAVLNTQITAVDMFAGGSAAKVVGRFVSGNSPMGGGGNFGTVAAVGAAGLGLGLVLSRNNSTTTSRRR